MAIYKQVIYTAITAGVATQPPSRGIVSIVDVLCTKLSVPLYLFSCYGGTLKKPRYPRSVPYGTVQLGGICPAAFFASRSVSASP